MANQFTAPWTEAEDALLKEHWPDDPNVHDLFPGRSRQAVKNRASKLGVRRLVKIDGRKRWSEEDNAFLKAHYIKLDIRECARLLNRSCSALGRQASKVLGLSIPRDTRNHRISRAKKGAVLLEMRGPNHPRWRGGYEPYYGPDWYGQRNKARERDNHICQDCGKPRDAVGQELDVHHIIPFREFNYITGQNDNYIKANQLDNLVTLCPSCHLKREWASKIFQADPQVEG